MADVFANQGQHNDETVLHRSHSLSHNGGSDSEYPAQSGSACLIETEDRKLEVRVGPTDFSSPKSEHADHGGIIGYKKSLVTSAAKKQGFFSS